MVKYRYFGISLALFGSIIMIINMYLLNIHNQYDVIRYISIVIFIIGFLLIPNYSKPKKNK
ncbi:membrane-bound ClpP family serine protease [Cytobacillus horneckiae]